MIAGEWVSLQGRRFYLVEKPLPIYLLPEALDKVRPAVRLLRSYEVQRMKADGFPFEQLDIVGEFWTSTRQSCSIMIVWNISETGIEGPKGWDKTFNAWIVGVEK